ncbi:MAG: hypothetical protein C4524_00210 [Candidatus Zixiibacteriota bacterium]|nr:MAG: hypothetical protein C4524_00210 [candidate division Zixibacteria bacterium]
MKKLLLLAWLAWAAAAGAQTLVGRVPVDDPADASRLAEMGFTVYHAEAPGFVDLVLQPGDADRLRALGYEVLDPVPLARETDIDPEYHTYEELSAELAALEAQHPALCRVDSIGATQAFGRTVWAVKLSDNVAAEEDEMAVLYVGNHHGNEIMGCETLIYMINRFLQDYGTDPQITAWMNTYEIFFVPLFNPDGHHAVTAGINLFWRKNARDNDGDGIFYEFTGGTWWTDNHEGVDLNRNYDWYWSNDGSTNIWSYYYRGPSAFSEGENQGMRVLAGQQRFVSAISFHSYGDIVIAPWTWPQSPGAPDQDVLNSIAQGLAQHFLNDNGQPFDWDVYPGQGGRFPNWLYGFAGVIAYDVELLPYPTFIPPGSQLAERTLRYCNGSKWLLERMGGPGITGHVRDAVTGQPLFARVEIQGRISPQVRPRYTEPQYGRFTRLLNNGTYTVFAGKPGYATQRIQSVAVNNGWTTLEIELTPLSGEDSEAGIASAPAPARLRAGRLSGGQAELVVELDQPARADLAVHDLRGRLVARLLDRDLEPGEHRITFAPAGLPSGVYFARLAAGGTAAVVKLVLVK